MNIYNFQRTSIFLFFQAFIQLSSIVLRWKHSRDWQGILKFWFDGSIPNRLGNRNHGRKSENRGDWIRQGPPSNIIHSESQGVNAVSLPLQASPQAAEWATKRWERKLGLIQPGSNFGESDPRQFIANIFKHSTIWGQKNVARQQLPQFQVHIKS